MKIRWLGHSSFLITAKAGTRLVTDPYSDGIGYGLPSVTAELVTVSHDHFDHNNKGAVMGAPVVFSDVGAFDRNGVRIQGIASYHDEVAGAKRGANVIYKIEVDNVKICHLGDVGQLPTDEQIEAISDVDVLLVPVGGTYTVDAFGASTWALSLAPKIIIPMHFKTADLDVDVCGVEHFISEMKDVETVHLGADTLPITEALLSGMTEPKIIVLDKRSNGLKRK